MNRNTRRILLGLCLLLIAAASPTPPAYINDFEKAEPGKVPDDVTVLEGPFAVREIDGNKCLELAGDPVGSFGALFGPEGLTGMEVKARVWGAASGKRFPEIGIGANDAGGYKLFLIPARHLLELRKGDDAVATTGFNWTDRTWTWLRLRVQSTGPSNWVIQGKAWPDGRKEPEAWALSAPDTEAPSAGRASIWGSDYSEQPIRFDDLSVAASEKK